MLRSWFRVLKVASKDAIEDNVPRHAAALAFYTSLSLAPLIVLLLALASLLGPDSVERLIAQVDDLMGHDGVAVVRAIIASSKEGVRLRTLAGAVGLATLLFSASAVFGQLQASLNAIWEIEATPGRRIWHWLRKRLLSLAMFGLLAFLSLVSLLASMFVALLADWMGAGLPWASFALSFLIFVLLFAAVLKFLPDAQVEWRDVWFGALLTAVMFATGKHLIGLCLARKGLGTAYGAAGSLIVVLVWVYYSSLILLLGAEITQAWAQEHRRRVRPEVHAVRKAPKG